jgi:hypothetical protein
VRYAVAKLAGYRNVWWSMANEFDQLKSKTTQDWDVLFKLLWRQTLMTKRDRYTTACGTV